MRMCYPTVFIDPTGNSSVNPSNARREDENGNVSYSDRNVLLNQLDSQQETVRAEQAKANAHAAAEEAKREEKQAKAAEHINEQRETAERNQAAVNGELAEFNRETRRLNNQFSGGKQTSVREFQQMFGRQSTKKEIVEDGLASTAIPAEIAEYDQSIRGYSRNLNQSGLNAANVGFETLRAFDPTDPFNLAASATGPIGIAAVGTVKVVRGSKKAQNALESGRDTGNLSNKALSKSQLVDNLIREGDEGINLLNNAVVKNLTPNQLQKIQLFSNRKGVEVIVFGSRASGTATKQSDFDFIVFGNSKIRGSARREFPKGVAGGEISASGRETGIDVFSKEILSDPDFLFDPSKDSFILVKPKR